MGNDESSPENPYFPTQIDPFRDPDNSQRSYIQSLPTHFNHPFSPLLDLEDDTKEPGNVYHPPFGGSWSIKLPKSISPICRKGHFCVYSSILKKVFIGYGIESSAQPKFLSDVWKFDVTTRKWERINIKYPNNNISLFKKITQRKNSTATISEKEMKLYVFGGVDENREYVSDFHSIDLQTGELKLIIPATQSNIENADTNLESYSVSSPKARKGAVIQFYNDQIYMWGGLSPEANILNEISVYDIATNTWVTRTFNKTKRIKSTSQTELNASTSFSESPSNNDFCYEGRANLPWQLVDNHIYAYGGSPKKSLVDIELNPPTSPTPNPAFDSVKSVTIKEIECIGSTPPENTFYAGMIFIDSPCNLDLLNKNENDQPKVMNGRHGIIVYLGGRSYSKYTLIYGLDLSRMWWFVLHVAPDGDTVSYADGKVSENGLFMTPRFYNFGLGYDERKREIIACAAHQGLISKHKGNIPHKKRRVTDINDKKKGPDLVNDNELALTSKKSSGKLNNADGDQPVHHLTRRYSGTVINNDNQQTHHMTRRYSGIVINDDVSTQLITSYGNNNTNNNNKFDNNSGNIALGSDFNSSSNYYQSKNKIASGMSSLQSGEKLFVFGISNVLAGLNMKEDLLSMQKLAKKECDEEKKSMNTNDDGEEKIIDF